MDQADGWYVLNVRDAEWLSHPLFGAFARLERERGAFPHQGVNVHVLWPGKPACRYHRENAQEDFLVLSGHCRLIVNGEERELGPWDFVHCPPGVTHVFVGGEDGPCAILMIGHRPAEPALHYPHDPRAAACEAQSPEPTSDPKVAYGDQPGWESTEAPTWPLDQSF